MELGLSSAISSDRRLAQAQHQVAGTQQRLAVGGEGGAGLGVGVVGKARAREPMPASTSTCAPSFTSLAALSGVIGARVSPGCVSLGTEIFI